VHDPDASRCLPARNTECRAQGKADERSPLCFDDVPLKTGRRSPGTAFSGAVWPLPGENSSG